MRRNPSVHPSPIDADGNRVEWTRISTPARQLETVAGMLELARKEAQMGVVGAKERYDAYLEEYERLSASLRSRP